VGGARLRNVEEKAACDVLLIAAGWQARTLILAQLQEAGCEVTALPGLKWAVPALAAGRLRPAVVVLDVVADPEGRPQRVQQVLRLLEGVPVVLLTGAYTATAFAPLRERVAVWLARPLQVGSVVAAVQRLLAGRALRNS